MVVLELEAALPWFERDRLTGHLHLLADDACHAREVRW